MGGTGQIDRDLSRLYLTFRLVVDELNLHILRHVPGAATCCDVTHEQQLKPGLTGGECRAPRQVLAYQQAWV